MPRFWKVVANVGREAANRWSWREELNLQPVVYKLDPPKSDTTQEELTQGKTGESEKPSS